MRSNFIWGQNFQVIWKPSSEAIEYRMQSLVFSFVIARRLLKLERLKFAFTANVNGKNYHVIMIFPPFFTSFVCRLPFSTRRGLFSRSSTTWVFIISFFNLSSTFTGLCLGLMLFYFIFYENNWLTVSLYTKRKKKVRKSCLVPRHRCESEKMKGARGLMGRERIANIHLPTMNYANEFGNLGPVQGKF